MKMKDLTREQLAQLRKEIVLNSLFLNDYNNSLGIDKEIAYHSLMVMWIIFVRCIKISTNKRLVTLMMYLRV